MPPPFSRGELKTPGPVSRLDKWILLLEHHPDTGIPEADLVAHFGVARPGQIIPGAAPEGLVYADDDRDGTRLSFGYSYSSRRLRSLVVAWQAA